MDGRTLRGTLISQEYAPLFARIDALKAELSRRRAPTQGERERRIQEFLVAFPFHSNAMDGNTLTLRETALVLEGLVIDGKPLNEHLQAADHRNAFLHVLRLVANRVPVTERVLKDIHSLVLLDRPEERGVYRLLPVRIASAAHEPPPHLVLVQVRQLLAKQGESKRHPIEKAALFHLELEGIYPFIDGNGRTGRLVLNHMLMLAGYPPVCIKFADRPRYSICFDSHFTDAAAAPMVELLAGCLEERLREELAALE